MDKEEKNPCLSHVLYNELVDITLLNYFPCIFKS